MLGHLLISKSSVAPIREQPIPRLKLCVAVGAQPTDKHQLVCISHVLVRLSRRNTLDQIQIEYLESFRIESGRRDPTPDDASLMHVPLMHVPTDLNSADYISRGMPSSQIPDDKLW